MRLGLIGFGNIATTLLGLLARGAPLDHLVVLVLPEVAPDARRRLEGDLAGVARSFAIVEDAAALLAERPDLVVECAGHAAAKAHAPAVLRAGTDVVLVSIGVLADPELEASLEIRRRGGRGAADPARGRGRGGGPPVRAWCLGRPRRFATAAPSPRPPGPAPPPPTSSTSRPSPSPRSSSPATPARRRPPTPRTPMWRRRWRWPARGSRPREVELMADPAAPGNVHEYSVASPLANYTIRIENKPSSGNAKTSETTIYSGAPRNPQPPRPGRDLREQRAMWGEAMTDLPDGKLFVGGEWETGTGAEITSIFPADGSVNRVLAGASTADGERAIARAKAAQADPAWRDLRPHERARFLYRIADGIEANVDRISRIQTLDTGKTLKETARAGRLGRRHLPLLRCGSLRPSTTTLTTQRGDALTLSVHEPLGLVAAITPWNSPIASDAQKVAPALAAGNAVLLEARILVAAGQPRTGPDRRGSRPAQGPVLGPPGRRPRDRQPSGRASRHRQGQLHRRHLDRPRRSRRKAAREADAGLARARRQVPDHRLRRRRHGLAIAGDSLRRLLLHRPELHRRRAPLRAAPRSTTASSNGSSPPRRLRTGPSLRTRHPGRSARSTSTTAPRSRHGRRRRSPPAPRCFDRRPRPDGNGIRQGAYYLPTILAGVDNAATICREEVFGPVLVVLPFDDEADVIAQGNDNDYGLACGIWTRDFPRAWRIGRAIRTGTVWVNTYKQFSISTPFGGEKEQRHRPREGRDGIRAYMAQKSIYTDSPDSPSPWAGVAA